MGVMFVRVVCDVCEGCDGEVSEGDVCEGS